MSVLLGLPSGNVGVAAVSPRNRRRRPRVRRDLGWPPPGPGARSPAACLLAQPSIGFNYAGLLLPAVVALWSVDRVAGFIAVLVVPIVTVVSPRPLRRSS